MFSLAFCGWGGLVFPDVKEHAQLVVPGVPLFQVEEKRKHGVDLFTAVVDGFVVVRCRSFGIPAEALGAHHLPVPFEPRVGHVDLAKVASPPPGDLWVAVELLEVWMINKALVLF